MDNEVEEEKKKEEREKFQSLRTPSAPPRHMIPGPYVSQFIMNKKLFFDQIH